MTAQVSGSNRERVAGTEGVAVPALRQELELLTGWPDASGAPTWMLFDPLRNRYFRLSKAVVAMLSAWKLGSVGRIRQQVETKLGRVVVEDEIAELIKFLFSNQLTQEPADGGYRSYLEQEAKGKKGALAQLVHGYLFFRIPLVRPDRFLGATWPVVKPLFTRIAVVAIMMLGVIGLYLVSRQWDSFQGQFMRFLSPQGFLIYGLSLVFVKICHELAHAYMCTRYGLKVPVIGVAFLVLFPVLYTDTSNAWRLRSRRQRLMIDAAGIMAELCLASIATILWVFLPDGPLRAVAFSVAAVSWVLSLLVNLNPFMRFDGYYILSDVLGFENLQTRGFALARWKLREMFFGLGETVPEIIKPGLQRILVAHAWGTWLYRFFLFIGIAVLIYTFFIKVIAVVLFLIEIVWFIALPVFRELKVWWSMHNKIVKTRRSWISLLLFLTALALFVLPLSRTVEIPAVMHAREEVAVFPRASAQLTVFSLSVGQEVTKGQELAVLKSERLELDINLARQRVTLFERRLARSNADRADGAMRRVLESELRAAQDELEGYLQKQRELQIVAPIDGMIVDLDPALHAGRTVQQSRLMFRIRNMRSMELSGTVEERYAGRLRAGSNGVFVPDNLQLDLIPIRLSRINQTPVVDLPFPELSDQVGGSVPASIDSSGKQRVVGSHYGVVMKPVGRIPEISGQTIRGVAHVEAEARSYASFVANRIGTVLMRETGI